MFHTVAANASGELSAPPGIAPGAYLTDGDNLFRVLELCPCADADHLITCEDCLTLELLVCPLSHLERGQIALVREGQSS